MIPQIVEITSVVFAVMYLWFATKQHAICWIFAIISSLLWSYASFAYYRLYLDAILQLFYVATSIIGLWYWKKDQESKPLPITRLSLYQHVFWISICGLVAFCLGYIFHHYTTTSFAYIDSYCTIFSIFSTWLMVKKKIENWWYWLIIDCVMAALFYTRGAIYFSLLNAFYAAMCIYGYWSWTKIVKSDPIQLSQIE